MVDVINRKLTVCCLSFQERNDGDRIERWECGWSARGRFDYKAHQRNERQRRNWCDVDEAASLYIRNANASTERSYVNLWRLHPSVSGGEKTSAIIQQAVIPYHKRLYLAPFFI